MRSAASAGVSKARTSKIAPAKPDDRDLSPVPSISASIAWMSRHERSEVSDTGDAQPGRIGPAGRMVTVDQHPAGLADRRRAKNVPPGRFDVRSSWEMSAMQIAALRSPRSMPRKPGRTAKVGTVLTSPTIAWEYLAVRARSDR